MLMGAGGKGQYPCLGVLLLSIGKERSFHRLRDVGSLVLRRCKAYGIILHLRGHHPRREQHYLIRAIWGQKPKRRGGRLSTPVRDSR